MLFIRLLLVGTEGSHKEELYNQLYTQNTDIENQLCSNESRIQGSLKICDKKVKIELTTPSQMIENLENGGTRYWAKVRGIVFAHDSSDNSSLNGLEYAFKKLQESGYLTKYKYSLLLLENNIASKATAVKFCASSGFTYRCGPYVKPNQVQHSKIIESFEKLIIEINQKKTTSPRNRRRSSRIHSQSDDINDDKVYKRNSSIFDSLDESSITSGNTSLTSSDINYNGKICGLPSATSAQVAEILTESTDSTPKKKRRRSFFNNIKNAGKKRKKRRESLLEGSNDADSDISDSEDSVYSSNGNGYCIEEMEGFFDLDNLLDFMLFSSNSSREIFIDRLLICASSCISSLLFAQKLVLRWNTCNMKEPKAQLILRKRISNILISWLNFRNECSFNDEVYNILDNFICKFVSKTEGCEEILSIWKEKQSHSEDNHAPKKKSSVPSVVNPLVSPRPPRSKQQMNFQTTSDSLHIYKRYTPLEVASQLTLVEYNRFQRISISEFLDANWTKKDRDILSPNLLHMIHHSTFTTLWIQTMILSETDIKERAKIIKWCINIAQKCRELSNFNGVMSIIGGLQSCAVDRLKRTWEEVGIKYRRKVDQLFDMMVRENYKDYRTILKSTSGPCVPFPGMWLSDLQFIECGNKWKNNNDNNENFEINLSKVSMVGKVLHDIIRFQKTSYGLQSNIELQQSLRTLTTIDDEVAYTISIELEPILSETIEHKKAILSSCDIDQSKCIKFETKAHEVRKQPQEILELIEKWNRLLRDDILMKESLCFSDAIEIVLMKLCSIELNEFPQTLQRELSLRLNQLFSYCLVGDSSKHYQLLECLRRLQSVKSQSGDDLSKRLIRCFKIPPQYRELSHQLSETQNEITKIREQLEVLEQAQYVADKDSKEHQVHRKKLESQLKIIELQKRKEEFIKQKDEKKRKILDEFNLISKEIQENLNQASDKANSAGWTNELIEISKNMKGSESEYIKLKKEYKLQRKDIDNERKELEKERERLLELLAKVDENISILDKKKNGLDDRWTTYQSQFSTKKQTLVEKTDDLMGLLDDVDKNNKSATYLHNCMKEFHGFFSSVLNLESQTLVNDDCDNSIPATKQQIEQQQITIRDTKRFLQSVLQYLKYFELATFQLMEQWKRNDETLSSITKLHLSNDVLHREFPQYEDLTEKAKLIRKDYIKLKKEFSNTEKHHLWHSILSESSLDESSRCTRTLQVINANFTALEETAGAFN